MSNGCSFGIYKVVSHHLAETQNEQEWESFIMKKKKKKEGFRCALIEGCWHGEVADGLTRSGITRVIG